MNFSWIELSKKALLNNIAEIRKRFSSKVKFMAVVKANAYGHGFLEVVQTIKNKVDYFAVYDFRDAVLLRQRKITQPILVLGRTLPSDISLALKYDIEITVSTLDILEAAKKISGRKKLMLHICADTGMGRDGFVTADVKKVLQLLNNKNIEVKGLYSHFAAADEHKFDDYTKKQAAELLKWKNEFSKAGFEPLMHLPSTAGSFVSDLECNFDMLRIGAGLYGLWPTDEVKNLHEKEVKLQPVLSWKVVISELKFLQKGSSISYGCTRILKRDSKIAILPIGYFDGIPRVSSDLGQVIIRGIKCSQLGRVTMNMLIIDVTDVKKVKIGDVATIIGLDKKAEITADDWAIWSQSSNYEIVTRINSALPRRII